MKSIPIGGDFEFTTRDLASRLREKVLATNNLDSVKLSFLRSLFNIPPLSDERAQEEKVTLPRFSSGLAKLNFVITQEDQALAFRDLYDKEGAGAVPIRLFMHRLLNDPLPARSKHLHVVTGANPNTLVIPGPASPLEPSPPQDTHDPLRVSPSQRIRSERPVVREFPSGSPASYNLEDSPGPASPVVQVPVGANSGSMHTEEGPAHETAEQPRSQQTKILPSSPLSPGSATQRDCAAETRFLQTARRQSRQYSIVGSPSATKKVATIRSPRFTGSPMAASPSNHSPRSPKSLPPSLYHSPVAQARIQRALKNSSVENGAVAN